MSTKIKRLAFEMLYCEARSENEDYRKLSLTRSQGKVRKIYHSSRFSGGFLTYH